MTDTIQAISPTCDPGRITKLLRRVQHDVDGSHDQLFDCLYTELHAMAHAQSVLKESAKIDD